jgi:hypothetical protein
MQRFHFASIAHISSPRISNLNFLQRTVTVLLCGFLSCMLGNYETVYAAGLSMGSTEVLDSGFVRKESQKIAGCVMVFGVCVVNVPNNPVVVPTVPIVPTVPVVPTSNSPNNSIQTQTENFSPIQVDRYGATWELKSCLRTQQKVRCNFSLTSTVDMNDGIYLPLTKMVDAGGGEYLASFAQIGNRKASSGGGGGSDKITVSMAVGARYDVFVEFVGVPATVSQVVLLKVGDFYSNFSYGIKYRNVPIGGAPDTSLNTSSNQTGNFASVQIDNFGASWELKSCMRLQQKVRCKFSLSSSVDVNDGVYLPSTKMVDLEGNEYLASFAQIGNRKVSSGGSGGSLMILLTKDVPYETIVDFVGMPSRISQVVLFQVGNFNGGLGTGIKYRDVPIAYGLVTK